MLRAEELYLDIWRALVAEPGTSVRGLDQTEALETIRWADTKARGYGLLMPEDLERFARFVFEHGRDYEARASLSWAVEILRDPVVVGSHKLDRLESGPGGDSD